MSELKDVVEETYVPSSPKKEVKKEVKKDVVKNVVKEDFFPSVIKLKIDDEFYLEVDLLDYFERLNRQGWSCSKVKKNGK
jgi:hypothetical protein